ncbi:MAG: acetylglutamate kinase [Patescibacteria group bacterium]|nr:acetylglutamate kinase [Patescibacteria group bacterium]
MKGDNVNGNDVRTLRDALPYVRKFRDATFVIKCGGEIARDAGALDLLGSDISLCAHLGIHIVLVHGGGPQADELSERLGLEPVKVGGRRVTDEATLEVAKMVYSGKINIDILCALRRHGLKPVGLSGVDGAIVHAVKRPARTVQDPATGIEREVDFGLVGDIVRVDVGLLRHLLSGNDSNEHLFVPVVSSLGGDDDGHVYNINADTVALQIAIAMEASKLVMLTDAPGLMAHPPDRASLISQVTAAQCREMIRSGAVTGGMVPKLEAVIAAVEGGVPRVHILDGKNPDSLLLELFTQQGTGTMVTKDEEEARPPVR